MQARVACIFKFPETATLWEGSAFLAEGEVYFSLEKLTNAAYCAIIKLT